MPKGGAKTYIKCKVCGKSFHPPRLAQQTCSRKCCYQLPVFHISKLKGRERPNLVKAKVRTCKVCGRQFRARGEMCGKYGGKHIRIQKYCGFECWSKRHPPVTKICRICRRPYKSWTGTFSEKKFCSKRCTDKYLCIFGGIDFRRNGRVFEIEDVVPKQLIVVSDFLNKVRKEVGSGYSYNHQ